MKSKSILSLALAALLLLNLCGCENMVSAFSSHSALLEQGEAFWADMRENQQFGEAVTVTEQNSPLAYILQYPKTEHPAIDARIEEIVAEIRSDFEESHYPSEEENSPKHTLLLGYETYITEETQLSLVFFESDQTEGEEYPRSHIRMFHFDLKEDKEVPAKELVWDGFRENASAYARNFFTTTEPYKSQLPDNYTKLLKPKRFSRFALTDTGVLFCFEQGRLFPESLGDIHLLIPYDKMRAVAAPVPKHDKNKPWVALTFDDGPNPKHTTTILNTLEAYDAVATFFDLGKLVDLYPYIPRRAEALGCEVGSHSYNHSNFYYLSNAQIAADVQATGTAFQKALGRQPSIFRPPYGNCDARIESQIPMASVLWSVDTLDWKSRNASAILKAVKDSGDLNGKVILMHGIYESSAKATALLVPYLLEEGYELVTVSELIEAKSGEKPQPNKLYGYSYFG